jgi:hypothetical protein
MEDNDGKLKVATMGNKICHLRQKVRHCKEVRDFL